MRGRIGKQLLQTTPSHYSNHFRGNLEGFSNLSIFSLETKGCSFQLAVEMAMLLDTTILYALKTD